MTQMPTSPQQTPGTPGAGRPAELGERFLARLIDFILLAVVNGVLVTAVVIGMVMGESGSLYGASTWAAGAVASVLSVVLTLGYFAFMEASRGQTFGKMLLKLQTFGPAGGHPNVEQAVRRNIWTAFSILGVVPVIGSLVSGIAQLVAAIMIAVGINNDTARRQAWHDQFAGGTYVLKVG